MPSKARACIEAMRPLNSVMMGLAVVVGAVIAGGGGVDPVHLLLGALTGVLYTAASMIHNDIVDVEIDRVNTPWRPIPSGRLSIRQAWACVALLTVLGAIVVYPLGLLPLALAAGALLLAMAYNMWGKVRGLPGNVMVALIVSFPLVYGAVVVDRLSPTVIVFALMVFLSSLAREIAKDIADIEGDRMAGARTLPLTRGLLYASRAAALLYTLAVLLSPLPLIMGGVNPPVYAVGVAIVDLAFLLEALRLWRGVTPQEARMHKRTVLRIMLIGLIVFLASTITAGGGTAWS